MPTEQLIFLDTEFTSFESPGLISIGLAASSGEDFYAEVPFSASSVSPFVREVVIPLLEKDLQARCSFDELHLLIRNWLAVVKIGSEVTVCFDSRYDEHLFQEIFDGYPPPFVRFRNVYQHISEFLRYEFYIKNKVPEHHALHDAQAMRYAFRESMHFRRGVARVR